MSDIAVRVENISKKYTIGNTSTGSLRETIARLFSKNGQSKTDDFWALKDVSFEIKRGEAVGIIGKNGAGKSTLLKVLSRITEPTTGRVQIDGRVSSLLEVGTGFHPELTGRENVFLNGTILGMSRAEVKAKFDEIVEFSGVEKFLDTPVKRYSSGMKVRLAFAVAAYLEPEVLIIDEVLAVGDAEFQKKCLGKMNEVAGHGRTVLFVSHNMAAVKSLCKKGVVLKHGYKAFEGSAYDAVKYYLVENNENTEETLLERKDRLGSGLIKFTNISLLDEKGQLVQEVISGHHLTIKLDYITSQSIDTKRFYLSVQLVDQYQNPVVAFISDEMGTKFGKFDKEGSICVEIPNLFIRGGNYNIRVFSSIGGTRPENFADVIENAATIKILQGDLWNSGKLNRPGEYAIIPGKIRG